MEWKSSSQPTPLRSTKTKTNVRSAKAYSTMEDSQRLLDSTMMDQKLTAMKKAYAEIILNTTKEAAVRIMESERKALRFKQELCASKEESLRMHMRLKQMLDAKTSEAEIASVSQQVKIKELEAQLQEAEEIVTDLRQDLRKVQGELEQRKINQSNTVENKVDPSEPTAVIPLPDKLNVVSNMKNSTLNDCSDSFASILMKLKEPDTAKNRYVQRIRACRGNLENVHEIQIMENSNFLEKCSKGLKRRKVVDTNNVLKYTFQRKRKRETLSKTPQSHDLSNKLIEINNGKQKPEMQSLKAESSRDSRRLMQVAHQLISLSEKRW